MPRKKDVVPAVKFPIEMDEYYGSQLRHKVLNEGDAVRCLRCGQLFRVTNATVRMMGNVTCLICPNNLPDHYGRETDYGCRYYADVSYYFDRVEKVKFKK